MKILTGWTLVPLLTCHNCAEIIGILGFPSSAIKSAGLLYKFSDNWRGALIPVDLIISRIGIPPYSTAIALSRTNCAGVVAQVAYCFRGNGPK